MWNGGLRRVCCRLPKPEMDLVWVLTLCSGRREGSEKGDWSLYYRIKEFEHAVERTVD
jgi:hypothetical protein